MYLEDSSVFGSLPRLIRCAIANLLWINRYCGGVFYFHKLTDTMQFEPFNNVFFRLRGQVADKLHRQLSIQNTCYIHAYLKLRLDEPNIPYLAVISTFSSLEARLVNYANQNDHHLRFNFAELRKMRKDPAHILQVLNKLAKLSLMLASVLNPEYLDLLAIQVPEVYSYSTLPIWELLDQNESNGYLLYYKIQNIARIFCEEHRTIFPLKLKPEFETLNLLMVN